MDDELLQIETKREKEGMGEKEQNMMLGLSEVLLFKLKAALLYWILHGCKRVLDCCRFPGFTAHTTEKLTSVGGTEGCPGKLFDRHGP